MKKKMQQATPQLTVDADGQQLVHVPLANSRQRATLYAEDYQRLMDEGFSRHWQYTEDGRGGAYVTLSAYTSDGHNRVVPVARLISDAGHGQRVRARDGNTLNLRNGNLTFFAGAAWFNAADWYPTAAAARAAGVNVEHRKRRKRQKRTQTPQAPWVLVQPQASHTPRTANTAASVTRVREPLARRAEQVTGQS